VNVVAGDRRVVGEREKWQREEELPKDRERFLLEC